MYELNIVQWQSEESEEQRSFRDLLLRLREGGNTLDDWKILTNRFEENLNRLELDRFLEAIFIPTRWEDVDKVNIEMLRKLNRPVAKIKAVHTGGRDAKRASSDVAKGLKAELLLAKGCRVMLTANLWTEVGLVNGSMEIIQDILFEDQGPLALSKAVLIKFEK